MNYLLTLLVAGLLNITPAPVEAVRTDGEFEITKHTVISSADAPEVAEFFAEKIGKATGYKIRTSTRGGQIELSISAGAGLPEEGYYLEVTPGKVTAVASDKAGLFYAMQTFLQLLPPQIESLSKVKGVKWTAQCARVTDYPRFKWRGFHLDVCRHFMSMDAIKRQIDIMASYKINTMHWHLTEDQGWRIEIKKYPRLTEVGAWRTEFDGSVYGGFYTQEQAKEIVAYAAERFVTVIPEIELPGHTIAAVVSYPELSCDGEQINPSYSWGVMDRVLCPGNDKVFEFIEGVFEELIPIFPSVYYHVGGDECPKTRWKVCPKCQARIKAEGLFADENHTAEEKLQSYCIQRVEKILDKFGKKLIGWDEILEGGLSGEAAVMSWRGEQGGIAAAQMHHYVVMTPSHEGCYFDSYQGDPKAEPLGFGRYIPLKKIYDYNPVPAELQKDGLEKYVMGVQACNWSEYMYDDDYRDYMLFPRGFALSEVAWSQLSSKNWEDFSVRVNDACERLDMRGVTYHIPLPEQPDGSCSNLVITGESEIAFTTTRPEKMYYTLDGSEPDGNSTEYTAPIKVDGNSLIKICTVLPSGKKSMVREIKVEKQTLAPAVKLENPSNGLKFRKVYGRFLSASELDKVKEGWIESTVTELKQIERQEPRQNNMQDVNFYGAVAEGYINISEDGVWTVSSDYDQVWIDGKKLIDNGTEVKRYSRHDAQVALEKGLHEIKVVFISNIIGGHATARNNTTIQMRRPGGKGFHAVNADQLYR
ncbi:MAG: family 20 glycosylhydrolase [Bacteroidales bacterium]|nr:family 20 glycosylhydrolase [Bacteroidales bacterium]MBQ3996635.1 family 20 glycosylhydrolase [Bacteroidales bacterium]